MRVSLLQTDIIWNDSAANLKRYGPMLEEAAENQAELVVFPEMFNTGFSLLCGESAREADEAGTEFLRSNAQEFGFTVVASLPDTGRSQDKPRNTIRVFGPQGLLGSYAKVHLFSYGGEHRNYEPGNKALTIQLGEFRASFFVCYDLRFPQFFAALAPDSDLFIVVANWPQPRHAQWEALLRARAIENQVFVLGVNRAGEGGGMRYLGGSQVISPRGEILEHLGSKEAIVHAEIDISDVQEHRAEFPVLTDRRNDLY